MKCDRVATLIISVLVLSLLFTVPTFAGGVAVRHMSAIGEMADGDQALAKAFTRYHPDIKVIVDPVPYFDLVEKARLDFLVKAGEYDTFQMSNSWLYDPAEEGHLVALDTVMDLNELGMDDYYLCMIEAATWRDHLYAIPHHGGTRILFCRKDLLEDPVNKAEFKLKYGYELKAPETWQQLLDAAEFFNRPEENLYGMGYTGRRDQGLIFSLVEWMNSHNTPMLDENDVPQLDSPVVIEYIKYAQKLLQYAGPAGFTQYLDECTVGFLHGNYAFLMQFADVIPRIRDPEQCTLDPSQVSFALPPKGEGGTHAPIGAGLSLALNSYSKHKEEALQWIKFVATRNIEYFLWAAPARKSTCQHPRLQALYPGLEWFDKAFATAKVVPKVLSYGEFFDTVTLRIHQALTSELGIREATSKAQKEGYDILLEAGQIKK